MKFPLMDVTIHANEPILCLILENCDLLPMFGNPRSEACCGVLESSFASATCLCQKLFLRLGEQDNTISRVNRIQTRV